MSQTLLLPKIANFLTKEKKIKSSNHFEVHILDSIIQKFGRVALDNEKLYCIQLQEKKRNLEKYIFAKHLIPLFWLLGHFRVKSRLTHTNTKVSRTHIIPLACYTYKGMIAYYALYQKMECSQNYMVYMPWAIHYQELCWSMTTIILTRFLQKKLASLISINIDQILYLQ